MKTFESVVSLKLAKLKEGQFVETSGYYEKGGTGAARYFIKTSAQATLDSDFYSATSKGNHVLANGNVAVMQFAKSISLSKLGAIVGNSATTSIAAQEAFDNYDSIFIDGAYHAENLTITKSNTRVWGLTRNLNGLFNANTEETLLLVDADFIKINGVFFSGDNKKCHTDGLIRVASGSKAFQFEDNFAGNILGDAANNPVGVKQYALILPTENTIDFRVVGNRFGGITGYDADDAQAGVGFAGGIYITSDFDGGAAPIAASSGLIEKNEFLDIYTDGIEGDISHSDAEGIRVFQQSGGTVFYDFDFRFTNNYFNRVQKSGIKTSGAGGMHIDSNVIVSDNSNDPDSSGLPMLAAMRLQEGSNSHVTNTTLKGSFVNGLVTFGEGVTYDGVHYIPTDNSTIDTLFLHFTVDGTTTKQNLTIRNVDAKNVGAIFKSQTEGTTDSYQFSEVDISNVNIFAFKGSPETALQFKNIRNLSVAGLNIFDPTNQQDAIFDIRDCTNVRISDSYVETQDGVLVMDETTSVQLCKELSIRGVKVRAKTSRENSTSRMIYARNISAPDRLIENIVLSDIEIFTPPMVGVGNHDLILVEGQHVSASNINFNVTTGTGTERPNSYLLISSGTKGVVDSITVDENKTLNGEKYAVTLQGCEKYMVNNINCIGRGVFLNGGDNIIVSNVGTESSVPLNSSATNVTQSNIVQWV